MKQQDEHFGVILEGLRSVLFSLSLIDPEATDTVARQCTLENFEDQSAPTTCNLGLDVLNRESAQAEKTILLQPGSTS